MSEETNYGGWTVQKVSLNGPTTLLVVELAEGYEVDGLITDRITKWAHDKFGDTVAVAIIPHGASVKALPINGGGIYHREKLDNYEIEVTAPTEADLYNRLEAIGHKLERPALRPTETITTVVEMVKEPKPTPLAEANRPIPYWLITE